MEFRDMKCVCKYDKSRDLSEIDQFGFVDLQKATTEGYVPSDLAGSAEAFDSESAIDPESIIGKPSDIFDAYRMQDNLAEGIHKHDSSPDTGEN